MSSGAAHDANHLAEITRVGMIFVPSKDGKSHCPDEWTDFDDFVEKYWSIPSKQGEFVTFFLYMHGLGILLYEKYLPGDG